MQCPSEIAELVLEILKIGVLRIRAAAWSGDSARCAIEADHIHNLPDLLRDYSAQALAVLLGNLEDFLYRPASCGRTRCLPIALEQIAYVVQTSNPALMP